MSKSELIEYRDGETLLEGYCAFAEGNERRPAILIAHDWSGRNELTEKRAREFAELGYVGFALDMYGKGVRGNTKEEKQALIKPFVEDRRNVQQRMKQALAAVKALPMVDSSRMGVMGYCFGGLCALDLARSGADVKATISIHGLLKAPEWPQKEKIVSSILALHGFDDPMVTPDQITVFGQEMTHAKVDWELDVYGNAMHAFTNPKANDPGFGTMYNKTADGRSWVRVKEFFKEMLG